MTDKPPRTRQGAGWGTRAVHAGLDPAAQGEPLLAGPVLAAPFHLAGPADAAPYAYGRDANPTWARLEAALGDLEAAETVAFASGMAAMSAVLLGRLAPGDVLVASGDGYPGVRQLADEYLTPGGVHVRIVPTATDAFAARRGGRDAASGSRPRPTRASRSPTSPSWPRPHTMPARSWRSTTRWRRRSASARSPSARTSACSAPPRRSAGTRDLLLGAVSVRDAALAEDLRRWRTRAGAIPGPFEAWLLHRSLATLELRLERQSANALALARFLAGRLDDVRHPGLDGHPGAAAAARQMRRFGALVGFSLPSAERAQAFLGALELVAEATSFGGVHSTAERRARWGTDAVPEGFIRFSAGIEDTEDLLADVERALGVSV